MQVTDPEFMHPSRLLGLSNTALRAQLLRDPELLFAAQRGGGSLGPGAEYMEP